MTSHRHHLGDSAPSLSSGMGQLGCHSDDLSLPPEGSSGLSLPSDMAMALAVAMATLGGTLPSSSW